MTTAEHQFMVFQEGTAGSFLKSLIQTIMLADNGNQSKLFESFPELVQVVRKFQNEDGYFEELQKKWRELYA